MILSAECQFPPLKDGTACDDNTTCMVGDACQASACSGRPKDCNVPCEVDECHPLGYAFTLAEGPLPFPDEEHDATGAR